VLVKIEDDVDHLVKDSERNMYRLEGLESGTSYAKPPEDWKPPAVLAEGEPAFSNVDNPGGWGPFTFRHVLSRENGKEKSKLKGPKKKGPAMYSHYELPSGCRPVPSNKDGFRMINGWEFHYKEWVPYLGNLYRGGATTENPYPEERKGHLDYGLLKKLGLNKRRIMSGDAFFFYQLLFLLGDPRGNVIDKDTSEIDPRAPYYSETERFTQKYAAEIGMRGSYGHQFTQPKVND
jgi:hypothetical protein